MFDMTQLISILSNFGFPVAVSTYLLFRFEKKLDDLTKAISENNTITRDLVKTIEKSQLVK